MNYKYLVEQYLDQKGIKYKEMDDDEHVLKVVYSGDNMQNIPVYLFFDRKGSPIVSLRCWEIANFKNDKMARGLITCNMVNKEYRWVKFYIDDDHDVRAEVDAFLYEESCGKACERLLLSMVSVIDEVYPKFMQAIWS